MNDYFNMFTLLFIIYPIGSLVLGVIGYLIFKRFYIGPLFVLLLFLILTYTVYNESFLIWAIFYALLAFISSLFTRGLTRLFFRLD
ncbi:uncharacterized protein DUF2651 [Scopulibacillus darangshiensis]|uniref:Uncharacterized protein DUF2651 n=1 Tax=Scopulibacillus darangshiensis TaxID=442528 RepID=A0A4R2PCJ4_9BACL|nr:DUF2651 family protein [Scopulibacillus darangshiensis]TCP31801.1 uncharacterized protein DUF2651 [Scopulibacillus darangshiensis]